MSASGPHVTPTSAGFTLLEVLIAFIIAGFALVALMQAGAAGLGGTHTATRYQDALSHARSHLDAAAHGVTLAAGDNQGDDGSGFHWRVRVSPVATLTIPQAGGIAHTPVPVTLYDVTVRISWTEEGHSRDLHLETRQIGRSLR